MESSVHRELINVDLCRSANPCMFMCENPQENHTYEFVLGSLAVPSMSCSSCLDGLCDGRQMATQQLLCGVLLSEYVSLHSSHQTFSPSSLLESSWSNHTIVLTLIQLVRIPLLFFQLILEACHLMWRWLYLV